jgi:hypothetical protein
MNNQSQINVMSVMVSLAMVPEIEYKKLYNETQELKQRIGLYVKQANDIQELLKLHITTIENLKKEKLELEEKLNTFIIKDEAPELIVSENENINLDDETKIIEV